MTASRRRAEASARRSPSVRHATVMMPTFRRPDLLSRALAALAVQRDPGVSWDLIVIDNDPPGAAGTFEASTATFPVPASLVPEPSHGSAQARNRGIAEAAGDVIVMIDDDVAPAEDWLARLLEPIVADRCDAAGGRVVLDRTVPRPRWFDEDRIGGYLSNLDLGPVERDLDEHEIVLTANAAWRADRLRATGGFDPTLGPRDGVPIVNDDALVTRKFRNSGGRIRYVPDAIVVHDVPATRLRPIEFLRRVYYFGRSEWMMDRDRLQAGRARGARVAMVSMIRQLRLRVKEGLHRPEVAFHAAVNVVRTAGSVREALSWVLEDIRNKRR